jgi:hypothetical protein
MQILLSEDEYSDLLVKASKSDELQEKVNKIQSELSEVKAKYARLLVYGVSHNNERLKGV